MSNWGVKRDKATPSSYSKQSKCFSLLQSRKRLSVWRKSKRGSKGNSLLGRLISPPLKSFFSQVVWDWWLLYRLYEKYSHLQSRQTANGTERHGKHPTLASTHEILSSVDKSQRWWNILSPYSQIHKYTHKSKLCGYLLWGQTLYLFFRSGPIDHRPNRWVWCWVQLESYKSHQKVIRKKDGM